MRSFLIAFFSTLIILTGFAILGIEWLTSRNVDPLIRHHIAVMSAIVPDFLDDNEFLRVHKIFEPSLKGRSIDGEDAGPELNHKLHWMPGATGFTKAPVVPQDIQDHILRLGRNWSLHTSTFKVFFERKRIDLKVFENLNRFSYWDVENHSPIDRLIVNNIASSPEVLPSIDSLDLIALCKLRLIEAIFNKDYLPALKDVRKLVELLNTTENYRLELTSLAILEAEHTAYNLFVQKKWLAPQDWTVIDSNTTRRASRAMRAAKGLLRFWTPTPILKQIFLSQYPPIGFCAVVGDALSQEFAMRPSMNSKFVFERDYSQNFKVLEEIWQRAKAQCHLRYLANMKLKNNFNPGGIAGSPIGGIPFARKLFGLSQSAGLFEGFKDYSLATN